MQLYHLSFNKNERIELSKILVLCTRRRRNSRLPAIARRLLASVLGTKRAADRRHCGTQSPARRPSPTAALTPDKGLEKPADKPATTDKWKWLMPRFGK